MNESRRPSRAELEAIVAAADRDRAVLTRREERVSWELHRAVAVKLLDDPETILSRVPDNIARRREHVRGGLPNRWLDDWARVTSTSIAQTLSVMLDTSQYGIEMRQLGPFAGALTQEERLTAIAAANHRSEPQ